MKKWLPLLHYAISAVLLGVVLTFAFAPYEIFPLAIISSGGILALWVKGSSSSKRAFWLGYLFGLGLFGAGVYWVFISIHVIANVPSFLAAVITIGMIAFLALYPALVGFLTTRYFPINNTFKLVFAFPAIWLLSEWLRDFLFSGFPWLFLGYSQTNSPLKGYAPIFSVYGVSLAVTLSAALLLNAFLKFKQQHYKALYHNLLALILIWIVGGLLSLIPWTTSQGNPISVALVQGNIAQEIKWSPEHLQLSLDRYATLTEPLWGKYQLIIWPEAAVPMSLQNAGSFINEMNEKAKTHHSTLILGIPIEAANGFFNAVMVLPKEAGTHTNVYYKRRLVPFGEYTPLSQFISKTLDFLNVPMSEMVPGEKSPSPLIIDQIKILTSICYEIAFPDLIRSQDKTIGLLLTVTNDAWFGKSNAQAQHLQMASMRAIELGRPVLFVSNDGITAIIDPDGRVASSLPPRKMAVLTGKIQPMYGMTPWMYNGTHSILLIGLCLLYIAIRSNRRSLHISKQTAQQE